MLIDQSDIIDSITEDDLRAELARRNLRDFVEQAWPIVESVPFVPNWHIDAMCAQLEAVSRGETLRVLINIPPGTAKSLIVSVFWPAWEWATDPTKRYLTASYGQDLATRDAVKMRVLVESDWYQSFWPVAFRFDQNQKTRFENTDGGWRIATSVGGRGTGEHPDRIVIDDPHNAKEAESDAERQAAIDWFTQTVSTRGVTRGAAIVIVMQRLHELDLSGHVLSGLTAEEWIHLCLPMRAEPMSSFPATKAHRPEIDQREPGELLWPGLFTEERVASLERALGSYGTAGQLQQRPAPASGGLFKREWFTFVDVGPAAARRVRGWDKAGTDAGGDWTAGVKISESSGIYYIEDVQRARLTSGQRNGLIRSLAATDGSSVYIRIEQEPGSGGKESAEISVRELAGYVVRVKPSTTDKVSRARPFAVQCEAHNVRIVKGPWNAAFIDELCVFPNGAHDDQVDAASSAFNELALGQREVIAAVLPRNPAVKR